MQAFPDKYEIVKQPDPRFHLEAGQISGNWFFRFTLANCPEQMHAIGTPQPFGRTKEQAIEAGIRIANEVLDPTRPRKREYE